MGVVRPYPQSYLDAKETMNVMTKQPVSMQFVETHVDVVSMLDVTLSNIALFVFVNLDSMVTLKWLV
jgi:hypothetical protein